MAQAANYKGRSVSDVIRRRNAFIENYIECVNRHLNVPPKPGGMPKKIGPLAVVRTRGLRQKWREQREANMMRRAMENQERGRLKLTK